MNRNWGNQEAIFYSHYDNIMATKDIFKDKLAFKMSNIVIFSIRSYHFSFFPEMSVFDVGSSNFTCYNLVSRFSR